ncbi:MAG: endonuclease Q family protein [Syntrophomonas sp.]|nr:endonuclease Q family protein [Syntrophomonas sp.]
MAANSVNRLKPAHETAALTDYFADLHIHIGSAQGKAVKITASRQLQLRTVICNDAPRKGLDIVGVVDSGSVLVSAEIEEMLAEGDLVELEEGGFIARNGVLLITACEVESREGVHLIVYLPYLKSIKEWQVNIRSKVHNMKLSTQKINASIQDIIDLSQHLQGIFCLAHAFTPHKGVYGMWTDKLADKLGEYKAKIKVLELGLSSDTDMADMLSETRDITFLSNSDAHSSPNVGREYNLVRMAAKNFHELKLCLTGQDGRGVMGNYGMHPRMGKYHRTFCPACDKIIADTPPVKICPWCGNFRTVMGVLDRIVEIRDYEFPRHPGSRPPYYYRIPLKDLPGIGPMTYNRLMAAFPNELELTERISVNDISQAAGLKIAALINDLRLGRLSISPGGGGKYGKVNKMDK